MIKNVLLDVDGTLVLSNDAHAHAWVDAFTHFGYPIRFDQVRLLIGMGADQLIPALLPELKVDQTESHAIAELRTKLFIDKYISGLQPSSGARELVQTLKDRGLNLVVATAAQPEELDHLLKKAGVHDLLYQKTNASEVDNSKPAPDIVAAALAKVDGKPSETIMIGDTPYDIKSASACGVSVIALRCGGLSDHFLAGAIAIYDHPAGLLKNLDHSPLSA